MVCALLNLDLVFRDFGWVFGPLKESGEFILVTGQPVEMVGIPTEKGEMPGTGKGAILLWEGGKLTQNGDHKLVHV